MDSTKSTTIQHYYWNILRNNVLSTINFVKNCQRNKKKNKKCVHLATKGVESVLWIRISADYIDPYNGRIEVQDELIIKKKLTKVDTETGWFLIVKYINIQEDTISNLLEQA